MVAPFVIDYASAPNATFCYGVSCDVVSDMRAAPTDLSTGSADMAVLPSCGDGTWRTSLRRPVTAASTVRAAARLPQC